jgi:hypothetical protein
VCRLLPSKILSHGLKLHLSPRYRLPIKSERAFDATNHIIAGRAIEYETRRCSFIERIVSCVDDSLAKPAGISHNWQRTVAHRIKLSKPAGLVPRRMKQDIAACHEPMC